MTKRDATSAAGRVLIVGATSGIARAVARRYASMGRSLVLAGRDAVALEQDAQDLRVRFEVQVDVAIFDAADADDRAMDQLLGQLPDAEPIVVAVLCHGIMLDNDAARSDRQAHRRMIDVNYSSAVVLMERLADRMLAQAAPARGGVIAVLSSVAGDRGRASNYCYGATKAALSAYADGLRGRLHDTPLHVLTIKPGPTATPMTQGLPGQAKMASPDRVAAEIVKAIARRRDVLYTPGKWRLIMAVIRAIPERLFKRLSI